MDYIEKALLKTNVRAAQHLMDSAHQALYLMNLNNPDMNTFQNVIGSLELAVDLLKSSMEVTEPPEPPV